MALKLDLDYRLSDNYARYTGRVYLTGTQALVRLLILQAEADRAQGKKTAGFVSGYRGSPLGAVDQQLWRAQKYLKEHDIEFLPAINEDLAATAVLGSQRVGADPERRVDGVFAMWYGKGPGVDRSGDALKHGNAYGSSPEGGVLVVLGDDHGCVSSSMPHQSEHALMAWSMPVLNPANIAEYLEFGLYGWALSRFSGNWVGFKAISETVEGGASVELPAMRQYETPTDYTPPKGGLHYRWPDFPSLHIEARVAEKLNAVRAFAKLNSLDKLIADAPGGDLAIVSTGKAHGDLMEVLRKLGLDPAALSRLGVKLYKVGLSFPIEPTRLRALAEGVKEILVVEEKGAVIETQLKELLYNQPMDRRPAIVGKHDLQGGPYLPALGEMRPSRLAPFITDWLSRHRDLPGLADKLALFQAAAQPATEADAVKRMPYFCSGCPHNTSTRLPEGSRAQAGIGCHFMANWMDRETSGLTQMGGEGVDWVAQSLFSKEPHVFQNLGDGTYYHSGYMAVRQAVAAGANITFKILYNDAVAMTGGQPVDGTLTVPQIVDQMRAEGVRKVIVVTDEPEKYHRVPLPRGIPVRHRSELDPTQRELRETKGVSVLIYDQTCAAEKRRRRKKGEYPDPPRRIFINKEICEGCGDCGVQSNCLSILPVETDLGRKRMIDQNSCNKDYSCVEGFCPSFVSVMGGGLKKPEPAQLDAARLKAAIADLPLPRSASLDEPYDMLIAGIGGTGVVTIGALVTMAAHLEGKGGSQLDFMGFAQKGGAVLSHIRLGADPAALHQVRVDVGEAELLLACDPLVAANTDALGAIAANHSKVIVNNHETPTGAFTRDTEFSTHPQILVDKLRRAAGRDNVELIDAHRAAIALLGDSIAANIFLLGYAWQKGWVPVSLEALDRAIELNGVAIEMNRRGFAFGRLAAENAPLIAEMLAPQQPRKLSVEALVADRVRRLEAYQSAAYAARYKALVEKVRAAEQALDCGEDLTATVARYYYKLMAYKDEYEVARLYTDGAFKRALGNAFEGDYSLRFHLAPPLLARKKPGGHAPAKMTFGPWMMPAFKALAKLRFLRGTVFDPFGYTAERRVERRLIAEYEQEITQLLGLLSAAAKPLVTEVAALPEFIRGYGHVKQASLRRVEAQRRALWNKLRPSQAAANAKEAA